MVAGWKWGFLSGLIVVGSPLWRDCWTYRWCTQVDFMSARTRRCVVEFQAAEETAAWVFFGQSRAHFCSVQTVRIGLIWQELQLRHIIHSFTVLHIPFARYSFMPEEIPSRFVRQMSFFLSFMVSFHPWPHQAARRGPTPFPGSLRGKRQRQNKEDVLESTVSYQSPTSG